MNELDHDEKRVLECVVSGMTNREIAGRLDVGLRTVELRRQNFSRKLDVRSVAELVKFAVRAAEFNDAID